MCVFPKMDLPSFMARKGNIKQVRENYMKYAKPDVVQIMIQPLQAMLDVEQSNADGSKRTVQVKESACRRIFVSYKDQTLYAIFMGFSVAFSFFLVFFNYSFLLLISDPDDSDEINFLQKLFIGYVLTELFVKVILIAFGLNDARKKAYLIGHIGTCVSWIAVGICFFFDNYTIPKILGFSFLTWVGPFMMNTYYSILGEVCNPEAIGISNFTFTGLGTIIVFVTPYIISDQDKFGWFCVTIGVIGLVFSALSFCFVMETGSLDKIEIHRKLSARRDSFKSVAKSWARRASSMFSRSSSMSSNDKGPNLAASLKKLANKKKDADAI